MKIQVSGFTFLANAVRAGYPFRESLKSLLPLVDEMVVVLAPSEDETEAVLRSLNDPRIRILPADPVPFTGPRYYAYHTDLALQACRGRWCIYLQADEVLPEWDLPTIREALKRFDDDPRVEGMALLYRHFYGSPEYHFHGYGWYAREVRILRNLPGIRAWGDAQGFRRDGRKLRVVLLNAWVHHYGWMLPPRTMLRKIYQTEVVRGKRQEIPEPPEGVTAEEVYGREVAGLLRYSGPHPKEMRDYLQQHTWSYNPVLQPPSLRRRIQKWVADLAEGLTGRRFLEYQNFVVVDRFGFQGEGS